MALSALGRASLLLAVIGSSAALVRSYGFDPAGITLPQLRDSAQKSPIARRLIVYRLDPVRPTVFRFTLPVMQARVVIHPVVRDLAIRPGQTWLYGMRAELLNTAGEVVATRTVYSRASLLAQDGSRIGPKLYFRNDAVQFAAGDEVRIAEQVPFAALRLTTLPGDPAIARLEVRVSERRPLIDSAAQSAFYRFSPDDQARLAAANAFPPALLTDAERTSIAINQWRPVGPLGIDGRDHVMGVLYEEAEPADAGDDSAVEGGEVG